MNVTIVIMYYYYNIEDIESIITHSGIRSEIKELNEM